MKPIKLYWCRGSGRSDKGQQNFGDYLSALIVEMLSERKVVHANVKHADMIAIGSVLSREKKQNFGGYQESFTFGERDLPVQTIPSQAAITIMLFAV